MRLPGQLEAEVTMKGFVLAIVALAFVAVAMFGLIQTTRLEGLKLWPIAIEGQRPRADRLLAELDAIVRTQELAAEKARNERLAHEAEYRDIARSVDEDAKVDLTVSMDAADRYIAANRVRWQWPEGVQCPNAGAATGSDRARDPEGAGRTAELDGPGAVRAFRDDGLVLVSEADIRVCTANTVKAEAARAFALEVEAASGRENENDTPK
jgi:hypothetical protein